MNGRPRLAESDYRRAIALTGPHPAAPRDRHLQADALLDLAIALADLGQFDAARRDGEEAVRLLQPLAQGPPANDDFELRLVLAHGNVGRACREAGDFAAAESAYSQAIRRVRALVKKQRVHDDRYALATTLNGLGQLLAAQPERRPDAIQAFGEAVALLRVLVDQHGNTPLYRCELAAAYIGRSGMIAVGALPRAESDCARAVELLKTLIKESPELPEYHSLLGRCLTEQSRLARLKNQPDDARDLAARALIEHEKALNLNPDSAIDKVLIRKLRAELGPAAPGGNGASPRP
jgi:tetratricopeptide (TPR) repeat protein